MKIRTPDGKTYDIDECQFVDDNSDQYELAQEMFEKYGILVGDMKVGEKNEQRQR